MTLVWQDRERDDVSLVGERDMTLVWQESGKQSGRREKTLVWQES